VSAGNGVRSAACELVLEALVSQKRIARSSAGYTRAPYQSPKTEEDYQGFDEPGDVTI
jgi:protein-tyrosine-phosphatase